MTVDTSNTDFEALLLHLKETRGFDFTAYKRTTLMRRVQKRLAALSIESYSEYIDFLEVVLKNPDLRLRSNAPTPNLTAEQEERMLVIFDMLVSLFERAYLVAYKDDMSDTERRRWNSWDDYMREWCRREDFHNALPLLLRGEDPEFQTYIRRVADEERGPAIIQAA